MINVNQLYKFTFTPRFSTLDGVYRVTKIMSFETALTEESVDFVASLYAPAGLGQSDYSADASSYAGAIVWELQTPGPSPVTYYVPAPILDGVPDPTVRLYQNIYLSVLIGAFQDTTMYSWILGQINDLVQGVTGTTNSAQWFANPSQDVYLTQSEYAALDAARQANIHAVKPLSVINQENLALIDSLKSEILALQQIIIASQA